MKLLAIETSCDETAAAVVEKTGKNICILSNVVSSQIEIHRKYGGIFPEHASRAHAENIIPVVDEALGNIKPDIIAVTIGPGLIGSLLVGVNFAKTFAYTKNFPIIGVNHWLGHIYSCFAGENVINSDSVISRDSSSNKKSRGEAANHDQSQIFPQFPALFLIASGGHTALVLMKNHSEIKTLGETLDDAAGEAFDKVASLLDLGYPGGPAVSKAAGKGNPKAFDFPRSMLDRDDFNFSFSGLKTAVLYKVKELTKRYTLTAIRYDLAASFQQAVIDILVGKTIQAAYKFHPKSVCLCGGVSANKELREQMGKAVKKLPWECSYHIPHISLTTDNAAMIGIAAAYHLNDATAWDKINADANLKL